MEEPYISHYIGDYYVQIDGRDVEELDVIGSYAPVLESGERTTDVAMESEDKYNGSILNLEKGVCHDPLLAAKAEKKGRALDEVNEVICWLTGYSTEEIEDALISPVTYRDFFQNAPLLNPDRKSIKGVVCGVRVETIEEPLMQEIRYLDKLIDELAKGKSMDKILRKTHIL